MAEVELDPGCLQLIESVATSFPAPGDHRVVTHPVPCQPCFRRDCDIGYGCLTGVEADRVAGEALAMLDEA